jgi:hypothetical protein
MFIKPASERTCKAVAVREGLSHSTVKEIFNRLAALKKSSTVVDTRVLGIDEISLKKRHNWKYRPVLLCKRLIFHHVLPEAIICN